MRKSVYKWGVLLLLAILVAGVAALFSARSKYAASVAAKVWPQEPFHTGIVIPPARDERTVLLLGDSRMAEWGAPQVPGWRVVNAGVPGISTAQLAMCTPDILRQAQPQIVLLQAGINDLKLLGVRPDLREAVISGCVSNLLTVITDCRKAGAQVIFTPVWPAGPVPLARRVVWSGAVDLSVTETNLRLRNVLANEPGLLIVDLMGELTSGLSREERFALYRDTLHLQPETYGRLSALLEKTIAATPKGESAQ